MAAVDRVEVGPRTSKEGRKAKRKRKARLIIHNLSFKANEDILKDVFGKFGEIVDLHIPKKPDGKMRGFAFVQFAQTKDAIKAINGLNATSVAGRPIAVDFSLPKSRYENIDSQKKGKEQRERDTSGNEGHADDGDEDSDEDVDQGSESHQGASEDNSGYESAADNSSEKSASSGDESEEEKDEPFQPKRAKPRHLGSTVFVRNLSFETKKEEFEGLMQRYGPSKYCLLCTDPVTDRPKGTGFVCYLQDESAKKCIEACAAPEGLILNGRRLNVTHALSRDELEAKAKEDKKKEKKDRRNLYLAREGLIRPGTEAAHGVSVLDMTKRARLQARKKKLLQNLHYFVSQTRLSVHNLLPSVHDRKLRALFLRHAPEGAQITEARVMRNLKSPTMESKGFGFVTFTRHEHALTALRRVNNNPEIFGPKQRPIVEFCLENRAALLARERRLQRSKQKAKEIQAAAQSAPSSDIAVTEKKPFMGTLANQKMKVTPTHVGAKVRTKKGRRGKVVPKKEKQGKRQQRKKKLPMQGSRDKEDTFGAALETRKRKLASSSRESGAVAAPRRKKWFRKE